ncbi:MAG: hypothetical protein H7232_04485 [Aeromicrobium sp.]|nr:hypothetical protein [Burkholderiales bacterium]
MRKLSRCIPNWSSSSSWSSSSNLSSRIAGIALIMGFAAIIGGCGSGAVGSSALTDTGTPTLTVALTDLNSTTARTSIGSGEPAKVTATFKTSRGTPIVGAVITFTTDATLGVFSPSTGTALTDANGVAFVTLNASTASGAGTLTATGQTTISGATAPSTYTSSVSYAATAVVPPPPPPPPPTLTPPTFTVTLTDPNTNATRTSVSPQNPARVNATFRLASGAAVAGAVVTFSTTGTAGTFIPINGTAVTDSTGVASVLLFPSTESGSAVVTATSQTILVGATAPTTVTGTVAYSAAAAPAITLLITDPTTGAPRTSISSGSPARVSAVLRQTSGAPSVGTVVTFATDAALGTLSPTSGTALTDSTGTASVLLNPASITASGAATVRASAQIGTGTATTPVTATLGYTVGAANVTLSAVRVQTPVLSAYGTTNVSVTASVGGVITATPLTVNFTSPCISSGKASITSPVTTANGVATTTYRDNGCASVDTITASVTGLSASSTGTLTVTAPAIGSLQFVSARPTSIALRGTGGAGRQETSLVSFRLVDVAGNPVGGTTVNFTLSTSVGGLTISPLSAVSDPATGVVSTTVQAGSVSTPVRVIATTVVGSQTLTTQSDQLTVSTGVPSQGGFSLSVSTFNIDGYDFDGTTTTVIARLADRFSNPVPDGVVVNFTSAGGAIGPSCTTVNGACSVTMTSQNFRTANGRIAILAYAIGEESFTDYNGNGWFDIAPRNELIDPSGKSFDLPEAWLDVNEDGVWQSGEPFIDFNSNGRYDLGDGKFNGVSCDDVTPGRRAPGSCGPKSINVFGQIAVVFSGSTTTPTASPTRVDIAQCVDNSTLPFVKPAPTSVAFTIVDARNQALPAGTTVSFATTNGTIVTSPASFTVLNTNTKTPVTTEGVGLFTVLVESDASQTTDPTSGARTCSNTRSSGQLTVTVRTPSGRVSTSSITVTD